MCIFMLLAPIIGAHQNYLIDFRIPLIRLVGQVISVLANRTASKDFNAIEAHPGLIEAVLSFRASQGEVPPLTCDNLDAILDSWYADVLGNKKATLTSHLEIRTLEFIEIRLCDPTDSIEDPVSFSHQHERTIALRILVLLLVCTATVVDHEADLAYADMLNHLPYIQVDPHATSIFSVVRESIALFTICSAPNRDCIAPSQFSVDYKDTKGSQGAGDSMPPLLGLAAVFAELRDAANPDFIKGWWCIKGSRPFPHPVPWTWRAKHQDYDHCPEIFPIMVLVQQFLLETGYRTREKFTMKPIWQKAFNVSKFIDCRKGSWFAHNATKEGTSIPFLFKKKGHVILHVAPISLAQEENIIAQLDRANSHPMPPSRHNSPRNGRDGLLPRTAAQLHLVLNTFSKSFLLSVRITSARFKRETSIVKATRKLENLKNACGSNEVECKLPERAYTIDAVLDHIRGIAPLEPVLQEFYERQCHRQAIFRAYTLRQKAFSRKVSQLLPEWVFPNDVNVGYGSAEFGLSKPGAPSFINLGFQQEIRDRGIRLIPLKEHNTSQVRIRVRVHSRALHHPREKGNRLVGVRYRYDDEAGFLQRKPRNRPSWTVRVCKATGQLINRDVNATGNMADILLCQIYSEGLRRGSLFEEKSQNDL
ncbi:hypothetical protein BDK51DRAFT_31331 [Blyttiomyces helicus]|uniref:Uncharacterized protein n=1 Tax=Blyttiomyces helicus TaxID=388810 RepID=A0A4P9WLI7_9FUNG|nr:hypothetical protein BDK51DRAFT_31331 [Blyttiomyces helicus]|eukprot:RKO93901.1 hypothetical protein BDK51DRAFT_31331 [Blyttiomyces helicus]